MLFNSVEFAIFLPSVFILYWFVFNRSLKLQNIFLVAVSYFFYGWWDWRFLSLIIFSSALDYYVGLLLFKTDNQRKRKLLLYTSISVNLGLLGFFKYFNFFAESFSDAFTLLGHPLSVSNLNIILPVGISFYTFQTLSYSIDAYKRKITPTHDIVAFFAFVSFFPQLVAGPIERASNLLPQFFKNRKFDYHTGADGLRQILWGLVKKIIIADNCAKYANLIFNYSDFYSGSTLLLGVFFFAFQIYGDFSGYSDIAIGVSRLFGFSLMRNFAFPYFSRDIAEFWRRWHISLTTWFRDYLYIPLGGSHGGIWMKVRNTFIIFLVSGFWHGANWNFLIWGGLNAVFFLPLLLFNKNRQNLKIVSEGRLFPSFKECAGMLLTFCVTLLAWVFFRTRNLSHATSVLSEIFSRSLFKTPKFMEMDNALITLVLIFFFLIIEWLGRHKLYALEDAGKHWPLFFRFGFYYVLVISIFIFSGDQQEFVYFQF